MQCPVDQETLQISERAGIEIDWCPKCRGIWLDRGELDKILERSAADLRPKATPSRDHQQQDGVYRARAPKKKKSFLQDLVEGLGEG
jgi:Zn-finger nucleic acid-binding protein